MHLHHLLVFFRTTGIKELTAAFAVLAVTPSMLDVRVPSKDTTPTNTVSIIPKNHTIPDLKKFPSLLICILSVILDIIINTVISDMIGIINVFIIFAINSIKNSSIGSITAVVVMLPVYAINVTKSGISV